MSRAPSEPRGRPVPTPSPAIAETATAAAAPHTARPRWLLFVPQLPASASNLRVRTWRRLQQLGAIAVKQAVYVLPDSPVAREDFEWLKAEIQGAGGDVSVFAAGSIDAWSDDQIVEEFRRSRQEAYAALAGDIEEILKKSDVPRRRPAGRAPAFRRLLASLRQRFAAIERVDFFGGAGRDRVATLLATFEDRIVTRTPGSARPASSTAADVNRPEYYGRLWVTRPRPGVDRMSSAWLIRRFIDPDARFGFAADRHTLPADAVAFDMFGVDLTHRGDQCTFETLCEVFGIAHVAIGRLAAIVHDLDLKDGRFAAPEAPAVGLIIDGLQLAYTDDHDLLEQGIVLFDALYRAAERDMRPPPPRVVAGPRAASRVRRQGRKGSR
jgi:hypothetical protein